jgi:hypothetical protein
MTIYPIRIEVPVANGPEIRIESEITDIGVQAAAAGLPFNPAYIGNTNVDGRRIEDPLLVGTIWPVIIQAVPDKYVVG